MVVGPFCVKFATAPNERIDEYRLRYNVYVEEYGFEPRDRCPDGLESDEFDTYSCSMLLYDELTGGLAASQRLILPERLPNGLSTNLERLYAPLADYPLIDFVHIPRDRWCEASRTTVAPAYRWGAAKRAMPAMVGLKLASIALARALERSTLFSLSDPRTVRLNRRMGVSMVQIGEDVDFHGRRAPFLMDVAAMDNNVRDCHREDLEGLVRAAIRWRSQCGC